MQPARALDEPARQRALDRYHVLDTLPEAAYDDIVHLAASLCGTPTALISFIDRDRQWFKARTGIDTRQTGRDVAICDHAIRAPDRLFEVPDLRRDARFAGNPYVDGSEGDKRFYAGMPLVTPDGAAIGTVCVLDDAPRELDDGQRASLQSLARLTVTLLDSRVRERTLEHTAFVAQAAPAAAAPDDEAAAYMLALIELQDYAGTVERLGERSTEKLLLQLDAAIDQTLAGGRDAVTRSSGSGEYVAVLHGLDALDTLWRLNAVIEREAGGLGLRFAYGMSMGTPGEPTATVFMRADEDLLDRKRALVS